MSPMWISGSATITGKSRKHSFIISPFLPVALRILLPFLLFPVMVWRALWRHHGTLPSCYSCCCCCSWCNSNATIIASRYGPHFEDIKTVGNVTNMTVQMGQSVYLNCRISLLQDKTVSLQLCIVWRIPNENTNSAVVWQEGHNII